MLYLDHAATSPLRPQAREAFLRVSDLGGNASSVHAAGRRAKVVLEDARADILAAVGAIGAGLVFTSGGTEANAIALHQASGFETVLVSAGEHDSIYAGVSGAQVIPLSASGQVDLTALGSLIAGRRAFVAIMLANSETGVINDVARAAQIVHGHGGWLHVDAVQALGKIDVDFQTLGADSLSLSAHKIGGGQGVGALIYSRDRVLAPRTLGGGQELGLRAGTENVAGIAAFAAALKACELPGEALRRAQASVEAALIDVGVTVVGHDAPRVPGVLCLAQSDWSSSLQLIHMDMAGVCVSSGSACSSGKVKSSRVVTAMGKADLSDKVLRVSGGWTTQAEDWQRFYDVWSEGYKAFLGRRVREMA